MKLIRFGEPGKEKPGIIMNDIAYDMSGFVKDYDGSFFANDGLIFLSSIWEKHKKELPEID
ncbi:MAG TPA: ureidoglycolate lyase, partial [Chitinophagaceae bacterium]|nr:ureidoglycolate lyase [Chitinophagaceae bacterium]